MNLKIVTLLVLISIICVSARDHHGSKHHGSKHYGSYKKKSHGHHGRHGNWLEQLKKPERLSNMQCRRCLLDGDNAWCSTDSGEITIGDIILGESKDSKGRCGKKTSLAITQCAGNVVTEQASCAQDEPSTKLTCNECVSDAYVWCGQHSEEEEFGSDDGDDNDDDDDDDDDDDEKDFGYGRDYKKRERFPFTFTCASHCQGGVISAVSPQTCVAIEQLQKGRRHHNHKWIGIVGGIFIWVAVCGLIICCVKRNKRRRQRRLRNGVLGRPVSVQVSEGNATPSDNAYPAYQGRTVQGEAQLYPSLNRGSGIVADNSEVSYNNAVNPEYRYHNLDEKV